MMACGGRRFCIFFFLDDADSKCRMMEKKERKKMRNLIVLNTKAELVEFLNDNTMHTLVNRVAFAMDLLESVRANDNVISIDDELGFMDDGGWIEVDDMGYVVSDAYLP